MNHYHEENDLIPYAKKTIHINFVLIIVICFVMILGIISWFQAFGKSEEQPQIAEEDTLTDSVSKFQKTQSNNAATSYIDIPGHNLSQLSNQFLPKQIDNAQNIIKSIYTSDEKQIFLTFDDGPSTTVTPSILETLKHYQVKATFFVLGKNATNYPALIKQEFEDGHYIANHGYSHSYSSIYADPNNVLVEFYQTEQAIKDALGNPNYNSFLFRFPGGSSGGYYSDVKTQARQLLIENGIAFTNWNCLTGDSAGAKTKEAMMNSLFSTAQSQNSLIVLMHDAMDKQVTAEVLPEIIEHYQKEGYQFKTFYDIFK